MLFAANTRAIIDDFKANMQKSFDVKFYGSLQPFIRWRITCTFHGILVDLKADSQRSLARFALHKCNAVRTPLASKADLSPRYANEVPLNKQNLHNFHSSIGSLNYLACFTRPDLSVSVPGLGRSLHSPSWCHLLHAKRLLRYMAGTLHIELYFSFHSAISSYSFQERVDAEWNADEETRRSTTGFIISISSSPVL